MAQRAIVQKLQRLEEEFTLVRNRSPYGLTGVIEEHTREAAILSLIFFGSAQALGGSVFNEFTSDGRPTAIL